MKRDKKTKAFIRLNLKIDRRLKCYSSFDERLLNNDRKHRKYYPRGDRKVCYFKYLDHVRKQTKKMIPESVIYSQGYSFCVYIIVFILILFS